VGTAPRLCAQHVDRGQVRSLARRCQRRGTGRDDALLLSIHLCFRLTRASSHLQDLTLDDPRLRDLSIGVQLVGNDANNTPPAHAIASRGIVGNVHGFMLYGNYAQPNPPAAIVAAVASGEVDVAMVWGPLAGYFARQSSVALTLSPIPFE
jgi:hypothetical protein